MFGNHVLATKFTTMANRTPATGVQPQEQESEAEAENPSVTVDDVIQQTVRAILAYKRAEAAEGVTRSPPEVAYTNKQLAELIPEFTGVTEDVDADTWLKRVDAVQTAYQVDDKILHLLVVGKMTGTARDWYHSKVEHVTMTWQEIKHELKLHFTSRPERVQLMKRFEARRWKQRERFSDYYHDKLKLGNRLNLSEEDMIAYVIDGFEHRGLQSQARMQDFKSLPELLRIMNNVTQNDVGYSERSNAAPKKPLHRSEQQGTTQGSRQTRSSEEPKCFNCGLAGHRLADCRKPKRERGSCYRCGQHGHFVNQCKSRPENTVAAADSTTPTTSRNDVNIVEGSIAEPYILNVSFTVTDKFNVTCTYSIDALLDTGSPINLLKSRYIPSELVRQDLIPVHSFRGINGSKLNILGTFKQAVIVNGITVDVLFYLVPDDTMLASCILGRDFMSNEKVRINFDKKISIAEICKPDKSDNLEVRSEAFCDAVTDILNIDVFSETKLDVELNVNPDLSLDTIDKVHQLYSEYTKELSHQPQTSPKIEMSIHLKHEQPISFRPRRISYADKIQLRSVLDELLRENVIRPSNSPYASPIVLVRKRNGDMRLCVDYRELNSITVKDNFPTPLIDDHLDRLRNKKYFSTLDLKNGFYHVRMDENSIKYTSFITPLGQFEFLRMPFGLANSPRVFQRYTNEVFRELIDSDKILLYLDDILIATETIEDHLETLSSVFKIAASNKLIFRLDKCSFLSSEITYLGYKINSQGIKPSKENVNAVLNYAVPKNAKDVHRFLGLASYFRRFIPQFSTIAKPLFDLIKKNAVFHFNELEFQAFETLKSKLASPPILAVYSPELETELHTDASSLGFGAVLLQKQTDGKFRPVSYYSKRTTPAEGNYHSFELECLGAINAIKRFHVYLAGKKFKLITDCDSFRLTLARKDINPRIARWALFLQNYDFEIVHRPASRMNHVDALSRAHNILVLEANTFEQTLSIKQSTDPTIKEIRNSLEIKEDKFFELKDGLVYRKVPNKNALLFYVPESMEANVLKTSHDDLGHIGIDKCHEYISRTYWFPKMRDKIKKYISECLKCLAFSPDSGKKEGFLHSINKGKLPFETIHIDHYGPLEKTNNGYKYILAVVDAFTKFIKLYACKSTQTSEVIKHLTNYFRTYSKPKRLISDRGTSFTSNAFKGFMDQNFVQHVLIATHTPRANGQIERVNRMLTPMISKITKQVDKWTDVLDEVEFALNNTFHRALGTTPSMALFGVNQVGQVNDTLKYYLDCNQDSYRDLVKLRQTISENIEKVQKENELSYNKTRKPISNYKVGDYVLIKNVDVTPGFNKKLIPKFKGPYEIREVLNQDRFVVGDIEGHQMSSIPFETVCAPDQMRIWHQDN